MARQEAKNRASFATIAQSPANCSGGLGAARCRRILQKQHADARRRRLEDAVFDLAELDEGSAARIEQIKQIISGNFHAVMSRTSGNRFRAVGVEFDFEADRS